MLATSRAIGSSANSSIYQCWLPVSNHEHERLALIIQVRSLWKGQRTTNRDVVSTMGSLLVINVFHGKTLYHS